MEYIVQVKKYEGLAAEITDGYRTGTVRYVRLKEHFGLHRFTSGSKNAKFQENERTCV
jgi:hypothetical protein